MIGSTNDDSLKPFEKEIKTSFLKRGVFIYVGIILVIVSFGAGVMTGKKKGELKILSPGASQEYGELKSKDAKTPEFLNRDVDFKIFWDVWNIIQNKYIDKPVGETLLFYGALEGMVASLGDPFSNFLEPQTAGEFSEELKGRFEGVGMEIAIRNGVLTVVSPLPESPAEKYGIRAADVIIEIDGYNTKGILLAEAVNRIRGEKGSSVNLKIYRPKTREFLDISVVREVIKIVSVQVTNYSQTEYDFLGDKKITLIRVTNFNSDTTSRFNEAVQQVILSNPDGLILDLRGNPGGYLDSAIDMADWWLESGKVVVREEYAQGESKTHLAPNEVVLDKFKTVVLINGGSASGSEIVAGALQDHKRAILIGERTFGKGSVQELEELPDGSAIKITIARWLTPNGRMIDREGIMPDIEIEMTEDDYDQNLDPQLDRAIKYLAE